MHLHLSPYIRFLFFILGVPILAWAIAGGPWWAYGGLAFLILASWGSQKR